MMPTRLLREGINDSEAVNMLSVPAEIFFRRLMSVVDDFGRFDARIPVLRARLYALKQDKIRFAQIEGWLGECVAAGVVSTYTVGGNPYLVMHKLGTGRAKSSQYPAPEGVLVGPSRIEAAKASVVYFIQTGDSPLVKIGSAICAVSRLNDLQTASPITLHILGTIAGGRKKEKELHRRFKELQTESGNEWFRLEGDLLAFIRDEVPAR
jgi:hypothetical protein